jgi:hypothetical protein
MGDARQCRWVLVLGWLAVASCGESKEPGETGLPKDTLLITLTGEQWQTFCTVADDTNRKVPDDECRRLAFAETRNVAVEGTDADVRATCQARYLSCVRDIRPPPRRGPICTTGAPLTECSANVGEAEQCLAAIYHKRQQDKALIPTCSEVTADQARAAAGTGDPNETSALLALPPCQVFQEKCPNLIR